MRIAIQYRSEGDSVGFYLWEEKEHATGQFTSSHFNKFLLLCEEAIMETTSLPGFLLEISP